jgi:hypothetical protein
MQSLDMPKPQEAPVSKFFAALISAAILASTFTSAAEAGPGRRFGFFLAGLGAGAMMHNDWEERRREEAYDRERARQMRADQQRAAAAAAAKRARLQALKQQQQQAAEQRQAAQIAAADANPPAPTADTSAPVLKKAIACLQRMTLRQHLMRLRRRPSKKGRPVALCPTPTAPQTLTREPAAASIPPRPIV